MKTDSPLESLQQLHEKINSFSPVSDEEFQRLAVIMHSKEYKRGEVILREGEICKRFYFIVEGSMRSFCIEDGEETNVNFYFENDLASDFNSLRSQTASNRWLIAMENSFLYYAVKNEFEPVFAESTELKNFLFRFFQDSYLKEEQDAINFRLLSPEERYNYLFSYKSELLQRISQQHLASFLGVSRKTLNRIRKKKISR
jgi:CRP-like cAMP-binding protein